MPPGRRVRAIVAAAGLLLAACAAASRGRAAEDAPPAAGSAGLSLQGRVARPRTFTAAELQALPPTTVELDAAEGHDGRPATPAGSHAAYTGDLLWSLVDGAGLVDEPGARTHLQHTIIARGQDGYAVALAVGEIDPKFEGKPVIVAYARDGQAMPGLKLVVPNDRRGGRSVRDLVSIEVR